ncbi:MAG: IS5/IS1182 family transposase, partial [Chromatiaceae bacterium]
APREARKGLEVKWHIAAKRGKIKALPEGPLKAVMHPIERLKSQVRRRVEQVGHLLKDRFHPRQLRYQGLKQNGAQHHVLFALANLGIAKKALLAA